MDNSSIAEQHIILKVPASPAKIYIREQSGRFQRIRRYLNFLLVGMFVLLPLLQFNGRQAIQFDIAQQTLTVFSVTLYPHDLAIFALLFILGAFMLFYITQLYGRVWCGYACPQTVWTLMFNWVERRVEGSHSHSRTLDSQPWSTQKLAKKSLKHSLWIALSMGTALVFISYFVPARQLYSEFFTLEASLLIQGWVWFFAVCTYINGGWLREKMCQHICPYSRFQSAMFHKSTKLVAYDAARGESRGPRKRGVAKPKGAGDCIDCNLCVQVCPVGIDIRDGLQYACINCGLCVDACDATMDKFNYPRGLIRYAVEAGSKSNWPAHLGYGAAVLLTLTMMFVWATHRYDFEVSVSRDRQSLYRINNLGDIENTFVLKTLNKSQHPKHYSIRVDGLKDLQIKGPTQIEVGAGEHATTVLAVSVPDAPEQEKNDIHFYIEELTSGESQARDTVFYAGSGAW
ncbi:cytochrome c oxidase accessory protein CcoG [Bowmanella yangjiangensis]|uniref:Cytochrome c oxidase accessory protein CcoG n=1 Tax=Bowmanella yangjiangensis TaxID=2811230 RepID=A0ABS3CVY9_9ALTE|nr:cytochrome c oxidase accessory protein CcoG [Bowmanella yangjiangensis]MBN7821286.1 cytochrome c oxidase accessory protein CcoG [Bowmanella yangjiangensis]